MSRRRELDCKPERQRHLTEGSATALIDETIQERVLKVIATSKRIPLESVQPYSTLESLGIDSLDRLNILFDLESEFEIEVDDEEAKKVQNVEQLIEGIKRLLDAKAEKAAATAKIASPTE